MPDTIRFTGEMAGRALQALANHEPDTLLNMLENIGDCDETRMLKMAAFSQKGCFREALDVPIPQEKGVADALEIRARCFAALKDWENMRLSLNQAWDAGLPREAVYEVYAGLLRNLGRKGQADLVSAYGEGRAHIVLNKTRMLVTQGKYAEALAVEGDVPEEDALSLAFYRICALNLMGEREKADEMLRPMLESDKEFIAFLAQTLQAHMLAMREHPEAALEMMDKGGVLVQDDLARIELLIRLDRLEEAAEIAASVPAEELSPEDRGRLAESLLRLDKGDEACALMEREDDIPRGSDLWFANGYRRASMNMRAGKDERAKALYEALLAETRAAHREAPERWGLAIIQAACYRDTRQKKKAAELHEFLKLLRPDDPRIDALGLLKID